VSALATLALGLALLRQEPPPTPAPVPSAKRVHLEPEKLDLGRLGAGESVDLKFDVVNDSDAPVTVAKVIGNCACRTEIDVTRAAPLPEGAKEDAARPTLRPGDRATIRMTLDGETTSVMRGDVKKPITVKLEPAAQLVCELALHVDPTFELVPRTFDFGIVHRGETPERVLKFDAGPLGKVKVGPIELPQNSPFEVLFRDTTAPDGAATRGELVARLRAGEKRLGEFVGRGRMVLDHPKVGEVSLHYEAALVPAFVIELDGKEITGRSAALQTFRLPDRAKRSLTIRTLRTDAPFAVKSARIESKQKGLADVLKVTASPRAEGGFTIDFTLEQRPPSMGFSGTLVLSLDHPDVPDWRVEFTGLCALPAVKPKEPAPKGDSPPPNVVLIVVDTLRRDHLGCYGWKRPTSPRIDEFARQATLFTRSTSQAPWTTPAIGAILTSQYPSVLGIRRGVSALPDAAVLLPEMLRDHGYATGAVVSHSLCSKRWRFDQGFQSFDESNVHSNDTVTSEGVTDRALEFVEAHRREPFLLWVHYFDPHGVYLAHPEFDFTTAPDYHGPVVSGMKFTDLTQIVDRLTPADVDQLERFYDSEIAYTDRQIGRLLDGLRERGLFDTSCVVFTADHGEEFLDHGHVGHTNTLHHELLDVPLIVKVPGLEKGVVDRPVASVDVVPTILDALHLEAPCRLTGHSLRRAADGSDDEVHPIFAETESKQGLSLRCAQVGPWKLVRELGSGQRWLYDLASDPRELHDLAGSVADRPDLARRVAALEHALDAWLEECSHGLGERSVDLSDEEKRWLEELGYSVK
jgi:arylsulfatase